MKPAIPYVACHEADPSSKFMFRCDVVIPRGRPYIRWRVTGHGEGLNYGLHRRQALNSPIQQCCLRHEGRIAPKRRVPVNSSSIRKIADSPPNYGAGSNLIGNSEPWLHQAPLGWIKAGRQVVVKALILTENWIALESVLTGSAPRQNNPVVG